jgi:hypothetical protein
MRLKSAKKCGGYCSLFDRLYHVSGEAGQMCCNVMAKNGREVFTRGRSALAKKLMPFT